MPTAAQVSSLQSVLAGLSSGSSAGKVRGRDGRDGTGISGPLGIESIIEYRSEMPVYLNVIEWVDTFIVTSISGLDSADLRATAQANPGEHGETPNDALWGGRTVILQGKMYAGTIWKLRDMQQGLRGSFLDIRTEYPLIFHGASPEDDLMVMCKLIDKINIPDQQTTKNQYVRDFQISLRASNPRFLSVIRQQQAMVTLSSVINFTQDNLAVVEPFTAASGLSSGYIETGHGYSAGSDLLMQRDLLRNMIVNPRGDTAVAPLTGVTGNYDWGPSISGVGNVSVLTTGGITVPGTGVGGPAFLLTAATGHTEADIEFTSHGNTSTPPVVGGDKVRITGWVLFEQVPVPEASVGIALRWWTYPESGTLAQVLAPIPLTDGGFVVKTDTSAPWSQNTWYRVDTTVTVPLQAGVKAFPSVLFYVGNLGNPTNQVGAFRMRVAEPMMDIDRDPTRGVLYGDGTYPGWIYEGQAKYSITRRRMLFANMLRNTRAFISYQAGNVSGVAANPTERIQDSTPAKMNNFVGHNTWWRMTSNGTGWPGDPILVPPSNAPKSPMALSWPAMKTAEKTTYNFSFYARALTVGRRMYVVASFESPSGNPAIPYSAIIPVQTHGSDGKDAPNEWRRFWADITTPAGSISVAPFILFSMDDDTAIPSGEAHEVSAASFTMGAGPRAYRDGSGTVGGRVLPEYTWVGTAQDSPTLGPWGFRNLLSDHNGNKPDTTAMSAVSSSLTKIANGGAVDNTQFTRATYLGTGALYMGLSSQASVSERTDYAISAYVRLMPGTPGQRKAVIDVWWYQDTVSPATKISTDMSPDFTITQDWSQIKFENMKPPDKATIAVVRVLLRDPAGSVLRSALNNDMLDVDRMMMLNQPVSEGWFGINSEWAQAGDPANQYGEALRYNYSAYVTPRKFYECQQQVRVYLPATNTGDDTVHLAIAYVDDDNQIYISMENPNLMTICRRDQGVFTQLASVTLTTQTDNTYYHLRARMADGVVFAEAGYRDMDAPAAANPLPVQLKYSLTGTEIVKYQDTLLPMRFGIQARGGNWTVDEWRYYDLTQPEGWNMYRGKGTVTVKGSKLMPLDTSAKLMTRSGLTYKISDADITIKMNLTELPPDGATWEAGLAGKVHDADNFLYVTWGYRTIPQGQGGFTFGYHIGCIANGVQTDFIAQEGNMPANTDIWLRMVTTGNILKIEDWRTNPALGGTATNTRSVDISEIFYTSQVPNLLALFGAGVKGEFGIYWPQANPLTVGLDDFSFNLASFDDIAMTLRNEGNFEAQTTISLTGPMTNPRVTNEANNTTFKINAAIPAGETWIMENNGPTKRLYRKSDGANRFQYLDATSMWVMLEPGSVPNSIRLTATTLSAGWDMKIDFRHTYM